MKLSAHHSLSCCSALPARDGETRDHREQDGRRPPKRRFHSIPFHSIPLRLYDRRRASTASRWTPPIEASFPFHSIPFHSVPLRLYDRRRASTASRWTPPIEASSPTSSGATGATGASGTARATGRCCATRAHTRARLAGATRRCNQPRWGARARGRDQDLRHGARGVASRSRATRLPGASPVCAKRASRPSPLSAHAASTSSMRPRSGICFYQSPAIRKFCLASGGYINSAKSKCRSVSLMQAGP